MNLNIYKYVLNVYIFKTLECALMETMDTLDNYAASMQVHPWGWGKNILGNVDNGESYACMEVGDIWGPPVPSSQILYNLN